MKTGIKFFDEQEFQPGDVVVLAGFTASGKSLLSTACAIGLADNNEGDVLHVNLESPREKWAQHITKMAPDRDLANLRYRGMPDGEAFSPSEFGSAAIVLDHIGLLAPREEIHGFARSAKIYAVRQKTVVVLVTQLRSDVGAVLNLEGWVNPTKLPEWVLEFADQIYLLRSSGAASRFVNAPGPRPPPHSVIRMKGRELHWRPEEEAALEFVGGTVKVIY